MSVQITPTLENLTYNWLSLTFTIGRSLCPSLEIAALRCPGMVSGGVRRKEMSTVNLGTGDTTQILPGYFPLTFISQPLPSLPHIKETEVISFTHFIFYIKILY